MRTVRKLSQLPEPFRQVKLFVDLSQATIQAHRHLAPFTVALQQNNVMYRWGFPTKMIITQNGVTHIIGTLEDGLSTLKTLGITLPPQALPPTHSDPPKVVGDWSWRGDTLELGH